MTDFMQKNIHLALDVVAGVLRSANFSKVTTKACPVFEITKAVVRGLIVAYETYRFSRKTDDYYYLKLNTNGGKTEEVFNCTTHLSLFSVHR